MSIKILEYSAIAFELVSSIRRVKQEHKLSNHKSINLLIQNSIPDWVLKFEDSIKHLCNVEEIKLSKTEEFNDMAILNIEKTKIFIPLEKEINIEEESIKLSKELEYYKGFLENINNKLNSENFIKNAPENVIAREKKKKQDAQKKLELIQESLDRL